MYNTPTGYDDVQTNTGRRESVFMSLGTFIDNTAADDLSEITAGTLPLSNPTQLIDAVYQVNTHLATYEADGIPTALGAQMVAPPITAGDLTESGLWSEDISDEDGVIDFTVTITLTRAHSSALTIYTSGANITAGTVTFTDGNDTETVALTPGAGSAAVLGNHTYQTITINITGLDAPFTHAKIAEIEFGNSVTLSGRALAHQITYIEEIDPIWVGMPMYELDFELINVNGDYSEDNPDTLFGELAIGNPINLSFTIADAEAQFTVPMGRFVISEKRTQNNCLMVTAYDTRWYLSQNYTAWALSTVEDLGTTLATLFAELEISCTIAQDVYAVYPTADYAFDTETTVLEDIMLVAQAYGLSMLPGRDGSVNVRVGFPSDDYGTLDVNAQFTWPDQMQLTKYNFIDIGYKSNGVTAHYKRDIRTDAVAKSILAFTNPLITSENQAIAVCNRIVANLYTRAVSVRYIADPALDLYDEVGIYNQWNVGEEDIPTYRPIKREITFNGVLRDTSTFIQ